MIFPYTLRLVCLCFACFFLLNATTSLAVWICCRLGKGLTAEMRPGAAARWLLGLRLLPGALGVFTVASFCVPSYLLLEPVGTGERVGFLCAVLGLLGVASWIGSLGRAGRAVAASVRCNRLFAKERRKIRIAGKEICASVVDVDAPLLAMAGLIRPRLIVSRRILDALPPEELDAALHHEDAHRASRDNFKRLLVLLAPDTLPFVRGFRALEQNWAKLAEWAADDEAAGGDARRALSLASALVRVARMGAGPRLSFLHTSLVAGDGDFSARVERLLRMEAPAGRSDRQSHLFLRGAFGFLAVCLTAMMVWPGALLGVHRLLELFLR